MEVTSNELIIRIGCVNKERHAKYAERGLELRTADLSELLGNLKTKKKVFSDVPQKDALHANLM